jgi:hypothetical protein
MERTGSAAGARDWTRWVLLGPDDSWGATLATSPVAIYALAGLALVMHLFDPATGLRMMQTYGVELEQNPLARAVMYSVGPIGLVELKLSVVVTALWLFVSVARAGRPRLARNCLMIAAILGVLGWASNMVG